MFENQLGLRENPFVSGHQAKYVYPSKEHQEALAHLRYGIENREPFVLITGEVGTGKTTAIYDALAEWGSLALVALITNSALTRNELIEEICLRFGVGLPAGATKPMALVQLERYLQAVRGRGEMAILLLDEAQNLDDGLLEEIRLLSNQEVGGEKLLQIFLVGQPELEMKLSRQELRQLRQRIAIHYRLHPLSDVETERYIHHRVSVAGGNANELFPTDTCRVIHRLTHGIPREINTVAGQALLNAFVDDSRSVRPVHVHAMATETEFHSVLGGGAPAPSAGPSTPPVRPMTPLRPIPPAASTPAPPVARPNASPPLSAPAGARPAGPSPPLRAVPPPSPARVAPPPGPREMNTSPAAPLEHDPASEQDEATVSPLPPAPARATPPASSSAPVRPLPPEPEPEYEEDEDDIEEMIDPELDALAAMSPSEEFEERHESYEPDDEPEETDHAEEAESYEEPLPRRDPEPAPPRRAPSTQFPGGRRAAEETPPPDFVLPEAEAGFALPSWLDNLAGQAPAASASTAEPAPPPAAPARPATPVTPTPSATPSRAATPPNRAATPDRSAPPTRANEPPTPRPTPTRAAAPTRQPTPAERPAPARIVPHPGRPVPPDSGRTPNFVGSGSISPRLRDKLSYADDRPERESRGAGWIGWVVGVLVVLAAVAFGFWRFGPWAQKPEASHASAQPAVMPTPAPVTPTTTPAESSSAAPASPSTTQPVATQQPATKPVATKPKPAATKPKPKPATVASVPAGAPTFGIIVGTFLNQDRANEESTSLGAKSNLPARVQSVTEDGTGVFRVVLGRFDDRGKAEQVASDLVSRGLINEARVTTLGAH